MNNSHTLHLFCPSLYLDGILGFLLALYLSHIPLQLKYYISGELITMGNKYFIAFLHTLISSGQFRSETLKANGEYFKKFIVIKSQIKLQGLRLSTYQNSSLL